MWPIALLVVLLGVTQSVQASFRADMNIDGGFYADLAGHVRDGRGLVTDASLYHTGFEFFPHPTPIYPLWPLLLGWVSHVVPLEIAAHALPVALYLFSLVAAWGFGRAVLPGPLFAGAPGPLRHLDAGLALALMLGLHREFARFTTYPYTEGLALALLMGGLWGVARMRPTWAHGLAFGAWLGALCLTRSQLFVAPIAAGGALALVALTGPAGRRWLAPVGAGLAVTGATLAGLWLHLRTIVADASPLMLLRFDQARANDLLAPIDVLADTSGTLDLVVDRLGGVVLAYNPFEWAESYHHAFYLAQWALPLALLAAAVGAWRWDRARWAQLACDPRLFGGLFLALFALGGLASVHLPHKQAFGGWYFARRHAVIALLAFAPALWFLARHPRRAARWAAGAILASSVLLGVGRLALDLDGAVRDRDKDFDAPALVTWIEAQGPSVDAVAVAAPYAQRLAWRTDGIGYHWFFEQTSLEDLITMCDRLGADRVLFRPSRTRGWRFQRRRKAFRAAFEPVEGAPDGWQALRRRALAP